MSNFEDAVIQRIKQLEREVERLQRWERPAYVWQSYTVNWTAETTNPTIGNGTLAGRYTQIGKTIIGTIALAMGSTTTYGSGAWHFSLPKSVASGKISVGNWVAVDTGVPKYYTGNVLIYGGTTDIVQFVRDAGYQWFDPYVPHAWASGDTLNILFIYEVA